MTATQSLGLILVTLPLASGCGRDVARYEVSGEIRFQGQPIPVGNITFEPAIDNETSATTGYATIRDGRFRTEFGRGVGAGKYVARIHAGDGKRVAASAGQEADPEIQFPNGETVFGMPLLEDYAYSLELPAEDSEIIIKIATP